ncbi:ribonuclease H-like YkuK family protein [Gottfriedia acidiceleris]|uniref:Ribonuclease H-like YkuK family protein n=2 Tax=Bacillaceae TaxID=186817 RepID=A0ABY4JKG9_9BACI|nr:ribonuclease H-like YkuK family protein [Gottfriedia acidiceleris]UPM53222.1 ribonuclease H-like YkuK family protein [Gottfriedia acidiceleris]
MKREVIYVKKDQYRFYNVSERNMSFDHVVDRLYHFVKSDPNKQYRLSIGTDSQVHSNGTKFITALHLHRVGNGAWGCLHTCWHHKKIRNLKEKIFLETMYSQEIAFLLSPFHLEKIFSPLHENANSNNFSFEIHLDIGTMGLTKEFIQEMTSKVSAMGIIPKIKPDSYTAFSYANKFTK